MALKHLVYFNVLAETEENTPQWDSTTGGLIVLRMLDTWCDFGQMSLRENRRGIANIRTAVRKIEEQDPVRGILLTLMDTIESARHPDMSDILPLLMAYGASLRDGGQWRLANDVFQTVLDYSDAAQPLALAKLHMQIGDCERMLGSFAEAANSYAEAGQIAAAAGDIEVMLQARIGDARIEMDRGNFSGAAALLDDSIAQARTSDSLADVLALALHERAALDSQQHRAD